MHQAFFWKTAVIAAVLCLAYVGHGLHEASGPAGDAAWLPTAQAMQPGVKRGFVWQTVFREGNSTEFDLHTQRAKIAGGWLVWHGEIRAGKSGAGLAFVPDPEHRWDGLTMR